MAEEVGRKVAGGYRVVREPDDGKGKQPKGKLDFAAPVDVNVVGPTEEEKPVKRAAKKPAKAVERAEK